VSPIGIERSSRQLFWRVSSLFSLVYGGDFEFVEDTEKALIGGTATSFRHGMTSGI
jgi:hypothetical protein